MRRGTLRWGSWLVALLVALALVAAACGNDDDAGTATEATEEATEARTDVPTEAPTDDTTDAEGGNDVETDMSPGEAPGIGHVGEIAGSIFDTDCVNSDIPQGGELTIGMFGELQGLDPAKVQGGASLGFTQLQALYDSLLYQDPITGELVSGLIESIESDDNAVWTATLREDVSFQDGNPVDADAFIWNVEYHQDPETASGAAEQVALIESIEKVDDLTVEMTLVGPTASFPTVFADRAQFILSPAAFEAAGDEFNTNPGPAGAGPFQIESWVPDEALIVVRNPDYYRGSCPYVDQITFVPVVDETQRLNSLRAGDLDLIYTRQPTAFAVARDSVDLNLVTQVPNMGGFTMFNADAPPFNIRDCRAAWVYALDLDFLNNAAFEGEGVMSRTLWKDGSPWIDPDVVYPEYDPMMAEELLASCEEQLGAALEPELRCTTSPETLNLVEAVATLLDEVGIGVTLNCSEVGEMVSAVFAGDYEATAWATPIADDPDPTLFVNWFGDAANATGDSTCGPDKSARNWGNWCREDIDELLQEGRAGATFEQRLAAYQEIEAIFAEELPVASMVKTAQGYIWSDDIANIQIGSDAMLLVGFVGRTG